MDRACMKFCEVHSMLQKRFGSESFTNQKASKVVRHAFTIEHSTYIFGFQKVPTALEMTYPQLQQSAATASVLCVSCAYSHYSHNSYS